MSSSRVVTLGFVCLFAVACTVVVQQPVEQAEPDPSASESDQQDPSPRVYEPKRRLPAPRDSEPERRADTSATEQRVPPPDVAPPEPSRRNEPVRSAAARLGIPPGHLPPLGRCRVWVDGTPPGRQARSRTCRGILATAPVGSWILYRPAQYQRQIRVRYLHATQRRVVAVRAYDVETGAYLRDLALAQDDDNMGSLATGSRERTDRPVGNPRGTNRGRDTGQADTTSNRRSGTVGRGNQGNEDPGGSASDKSRGQDRGRATGQADTTSNRRSGTVGRGNQGNEDPGGSASDKSRGQDRGRTAGQADTTSNSRSPSGGQGAEASPNADRGSNEVTRGGNRDEPAVPTDPSGSIRPVGGVSGTGTDVSAGSKPEDGSAAAVEEAAGTATRKQVVLGIDDRQLPPPGRCRVWVPNQPAEQQARPGVCGRIAARAPAGSWIIRRTPDQPEVILVDYVDETRAGVVVRTSAFDAETGALLPEWQPTLRPGNRP
jgi:hypothetical protein